MHGKDVSCLLLVAFQAFALSCSAMQKGFAYWVRSHDELEATILGFNVWVVAVQRLVGPAVYTCVPFMGDGLKEFLYCLLVLLQNQSGKTEELSFKWCQAWRVMIIIIRTKFVVSFIFQTLLAWKVSSLT